MGKARQFFQMGEQFARLWAEFWGGRQCVALDVGLFGGALGKKSYLPNTNNHEFFERKIKGYIHLPVL